jgi:hypothetical protein
VHELDGADLPARRYEHVDLRPLGVATARGSAAQTVPTAGLHPGHHRVRAAQEECGVHELVDGGVSREQQYDSWQHPLPRAAFEAALIGGPLGDSLSDEVSHCCDAGREGVP